jgi:hypothetical protein
MLKGHLQIHVLCSTIHKSQEMGHLGQPKCPSADEWINKIWHIYTIEYYSAIKRMNSCYKNTDGTGEHYAKWSKPDTEIQVSHNFTHNVEYKNVDLIEGKNEMVVTRAWGWEEWRKIDGW